MAKLLGPNICYLHNVDLKKDGTKKEGSKYHLKRYKDNKTFCNLSTIDIYDHGHWYKFELKKVAKEDLCKKCTRTFHVED